MTPFAVQLRAIRTTFGLAQGEFAKRIGFRQNYISAVECGAKLPKDSTLVDRTIAALQLDTASAQALTEALQLSRPLDFPRQGTPAFAYALCAHFSRMTPRFTQAQVRALQEFLNVLDQAPRPADLPKTQSANKAA
ncbi:transcriptional regulator with XRE-family HTH domain [Paraburkholderia graminis]|uniref:helix-turn-helix domain-containing protein n=1 Tax=Paraburkholderia graminis TaxID=60548 RepID=UPI0028557E91|nr:XRE family transcriptional regulator [Paraburkholderia graminis]MDR6468676.1 transcriptional regulator with XRE-family HTH domain [Paraburkholderia graminis]